MATSLNYVNKGSDFVKDYVCSACESTNIEEIADYFCEKCMKYFCGKCICQHDILYKNHSKYGREETNKWPLTKKMEDLLLKCDVHNKKLNMFCQDHSLLGCSNCLLLNHRQCTNVALISESVKKLSLDMQQLSIDLRTVLDQLDMFKSTQEASIQFVEESFSEQLQDIRDLRNKLNATLDELENTTLKELYEIRSTLQTSLNKDVDNCSRLKEELLQLDEAVHGLCEKSKKEIEFIASRKFLQKIQEIRKYLTENPAKAPSSMMFQANINIDEFLSKKSCLGRIVVINTNQVLTVKRKSEYNVNIVSDKNQTCSIRGICSLPSGHFIVVDDCNKKVKLFDHQYKPVSHCDMSGQLNDICQITFSEVAVAFDSDVQFISVRNRLLINGRRFRFKHHAAAGIAHHHGALYVTSGNALYHYTLTGTLVKKLLVDEEGYTVCKCAVRPAGDRIYVTNYAFTKLLTLAMNGTLISTFKDTELEAPWGVHVTPAGQVLICGSISNTVIQVDPEGRKKLATLLSQKDGVRHPVCVCFNKNIDQIIVGLEDNKVIVLKLQ